MILLSHYDTIIFAFAEYTKKSFFCAMALLKQITPDLSQYKQGYFVKGISLDNVIFGFHEEQFKVLLLQCRNKKNWMLPGGHVLCEENVDDAAKRILQDRTGLKNVYLQQFWLFGDTERSSPKVVHAAMKALQLDGANSDWMKERFVTVGYYALVEFAKVNPNPDALSLSCEWHDLLQLPPLIFDHRAIVEKALEQLRYHLLYQPVGYNLLPKQFTLRQLQSIYELILNKKLDRPNFNRKMLSLGILIKKEKLFSGSAHKAPYLYSFHKKNYFKFLSQGFSDWF